MQTLKRVLRFLVSTFFIIARIKGIDVSTYFYTSGVRTTYPSGAVEFTPISSVELVFLNPMSGIPFKKMNAFLAQIDIGLIKSFFFNFLNFLDILFMLLYDEID
jgi:hypothetical protein